jgi:hypothetical protein
VGLEHNPAAGIDLAESRNALCLYLKNLDTSSPTKEWAMNGLQVPDGIENAQAMGGVYAILNDQLRLFTLGSVSRGVPYNEWTIPLPVVAPVEFGFHPGADIIAFVKLADPMCVYSSSTSSLRTHSHVTGIWGL